MVCLGSFADDRTITEEPFLQTLGGAVEEAIDKVNKQVELPRGYHVNWEGEYESQKRSEARLLIIVPLTVFLIFMIIYGAFGSAKWAGLHLVNVGVARVGGLLALWVTGRKDIVSRTIDSGAFLFHVWAPLTEVRSGHVTLPSRRMESHESSSSGITGFAEAVAGVAV